MRKQLLFLLMVFLYISVSSQNFASWDNYLNGNEVSAIVEDTNYIYIGTKEGGVVQINKSTDAKVYFDSSNSELLGNRISAIAKDSQGNIWVSSNVGANGINGMNGGLAKYDGANWISYDYANTGIYLAHINSITIDSDDTLWLGIGLSTAGDEVVTFDGTTWTTYNSSNTNLPSYQVNAISIDDNDVKWISTYGGGLVKYNNSTWEVFDTSNSNIPNNTIYDVDIDSNGVKWVATDGGLVEFNDTTWINHVVGYHIYSVEIDDTDDKWIAMWDEEFDVTSGLYVHAGKGIVKFTNDANYIQYLPSNSNIPNTDAYTITIADNGDKLIGTGFGLGIFDDNSWQNTNPSRFPIFNDAGITINLRGVKTITDMKIDAIGNKWFAIHGVGIAKFNNVDWEIYNTYTSGLHNRFVNSIVIADNGDVWFGTQNGIGNFDGTNWFSFTSSNSNFPSDSNIGTVEAIDNNGVIWGTLKYSVTAKGMFKYDGTSFTQYNTSNSNLISNSIGNIDVDLNNHKWFGNSNSLFEYDDTNFTIYDNSNSGLPDESVLNIQIDGNGKKWIRAGTGGFFGGTAYLVSFDGTSWNSYSSPSEIGFSIDTENNLWFGSDNDGLRNYSGTDAGNLMTLDHSNSPIPYMKVTRPQFDGNEIWISTPAGLSSFVLADPLLTYVPDNNFEQKLIDLGYDDVLDDYVLTNNIDDVTYLVLNSLNITDLTGIEDFTALTVLSIAYNQITTFDISQNTALREFYCTDNPLTIIDISQNTLLEYFYSDLNPTVTSINFEFNTHLEVVSCMNNQIQYVDLSNSPNLIQAEFRNNNLIEINVRNGNNANVTNNYFVVSNNPNLRCVYVDNATWSTNNWLNIDTTATFIETEVECSALLSVEELFTSSIKVYPNPTDSIIHIDNEGDFEIINIKVFNVFGQQIIEQGSTNSIDLSRLNNGLYFLNIENSNGEKGSFKIIKK